METVCHNVKRWQGGDVQPWFRSELQRLRLCREEARIESDMAGVRSTRGHESGVMWVEQDIEFFRDYDRGNPDSKLITSGHPPMSRCLAGSDMVEVSNE